MDRESLFSSGPALWHPCNLCEKCNVKTETWKEGFDSSNSKRTIFLVLQREKWLDITSGMNYIDHIDSPQVRDL
jgi:hypothetical protein